MKISEPVFQILKKVIREDFRYANFYKNADKEDWHDDADFDILFLAILGKSNLNRMQLKELILTADAKQWSLAEFNRKAFSNKLDDAQPPPSLESHE